MSDSQTLVDRLKADLTSNASVSGVAAVLAVVAWVGFSRLDGVTTGGLLLALSIAVFVPYAYERVWPDVYSGVEAAVWTVSAAFVTAGLFVGSYQLLLTAVSVEYATGLAFVVTVALQYGTAALFLRARHTA